MHPYPPFYRHILQEQDRIKTMKFHRALFELALIYNWMPHIIDFTSPEAMFVGAYSPIAKWSIVHISISLN